MERRAIPPYTLPFVLTTWLLLYLLNESGLSLQRDYSIQTSSKMDILSSLSKGLGQIMFQASNISGISFLIGIMINSRLSALYAVTGVLLGTIIPYCISLPLNMINNGIFGFNAALCGLAFASVNNKYTYIYVLFASVLSESYPIP